MSGTISDCKKTQSDELERKKGQSLMDVMQHGGEMIPEEIQNQ